MHVAEATFTSQEVEELLVQRGFVVGSPEFYEERRRAFLPAEITSQQGEILFVEDVHYEPGYCKEKIDGTAHTT